MKNSQRKAMFARINALPLSCNRLPVQVSTIVPSTKNVSGKSKNCSGNEFVRRVNGEKLFMNKRFGGTTSVKEVGSYNMDGKRVDEKGVIVETSMTTKDYNDNSVILADHYRNNQKKWKQDTVLVKVEGESFITPKKPYIGDEKTKRKILVT